MPVDGGPLDVADRRDGGVAATGAVRQELHLAVVNAVTSHHHLIITSSHITKSSHDHNHIIRHHMITITSSQLHHHNHIITHHIITPVCEEVVEVVVPLALSAENVQLPVARMEEHGVAGPRLDPGSRILTQGSPLQGSLGSSRARVVLDQPPAAGRNVVDVQPGELLLRPRPSATATGLNTNLFIFF